MESVKSIAMLFIMGVMLFPWQMICVAHPFGHEHHEHDGPSPCDLRRQHKGTDPVFWPPMDCDQIFSRIDDFQRPQTENVKPILQPVAVSHVFALVPIPEYECDFISLPDSRSNSDPPQTSKTYRGPP